MRKGGILGVLHASLLHSLASELRWNGGAGWDREMYVAVGIADAIDRGLCGSTVSQLGLCAGKVTPLASAHFGVPETCSVAVIVSPGKHILSGSCIPSARRGNLVDLALLPRPQTELKPPSIRTFSSALHLSIQWRATRSITCCLSQVGIIDAHSGGVGLAVSTDTLTLITGTSTCLMIVSESPIFIPGAPSGRHPHH